jgi:uncharacterized membrane protein YhaH (DUF805 family)
MSTKDLLFSFQGRVGRKPFWLTLLAVTVIAVVLNILAFGAALAGAGMSADPAGASSGGALGGIAMVVVLVVSLVLVWVGLAVQAKRWHDQDKSAWWILINLVPGVGGLITLVMCGFLEGTAGVNRFGPQAS